MCRSPFSVHRNLPVLIVRETSRMSGRGNDVSVDVAADFGVASAESRFWANFARLGFHHGFGMTVTLPAVVGQQVALDLLFTGRRVRGEEALELGLCDRLVSTDRIRHEAHTFATEIA